mgnify:CR=1 FL=1
MLTHGAMFKILMPIYLNEKFGVERTYTSDDDVFIKEDKRQKPCGEKKITQIKSDLDEWSRTKNWERNQILVDFNQIPEWVEEKIIHEWEKPISGKRNMLLNYFIKHKLKNLMEDIQEF